MKVIIDRFEGDFAVVEIDLDAFVELPRILIPDATEGDVVEIIVRKDQTNERRETIENLMNQVFID